MSDLPPDLPNPEQDTTIRLDPRLERAVRGIAGVATSFVQEITPDLSPLLPNLPSAFDPKLPDVDELFAKEMLPDVDDLFKPPKPWYSKSPALTHFVEGYSRVWDHAMNTTAIPGQPEPTRKVLQDAGILSSADARVTTITQYFTQYLNDTLYQGGTAVMGTVMGAGSAAVAVGVPRELVGAALEVFPAGRLTGLPLRSGAPLVGPRQVPSPTMERVLPRGMPLDLDAAAELGVFGTRSPALTASERYNPPQMADIYFDAPAPRTAEAAAVGSPETVFSTVHPSDPSIWPPGHPAAEAAGASIVGARTPREIAAAIDPPLFEAYDALNGEITQLNGLIREEQAARARHEVAVNLQNEIDTTLGKVNGVESRLTKTQQDRLDYARRVLDQYVTEDTPAITLMRRRLQEADEEMRTLAPRVGEAIREVNEIAGDPVAPAVVAPRGAHTTINRLATGGYEVIVDTPDGTGRFAAITAEAAEAQAARLRVAYAQREALLTAKTEVEAGRPLEYRVDPSGRISVIVDGERLRLDLDVELRGALRRAEHERNLADRAEDVARHEAEIQAIIRRGVEDLKVEALPMRLTEKPGVAAATARFENQLTTTGQLDPSDIQREFGVGLGMANHIRDRLIAKNAEKLRSLYQRNQSIAADTAKKLQEAGRSEAEAKAAGRIVQSMYEAHAARFKGELGTAWDIYQREAPNIRQGSRRRDDAGGIPFVMTAAMKRGLSGLRYTAEQIRGMTPGQAHEILSRGGRSFEQPARGRYTLADPARNARSIITLFRRADPSTFMHETAHDWLERLFRDSAHAKAPAGLIEDVATVREWLGLREGANAAEWERAHEQFATAFERYLAEGTAPSRGLARVFQQFKEWLAEVYRNGITAGVPINDNIRRVFDRMLVPEREPIIAPERPAPRDPAAEARATPPHLAEGKADDLLAEREAASTQLRAEIANGRREARRRPERTSVSDGGAEDPKTVFNRTAGIGPDDNVGEGRTVSSGKSETPQTTGEGFPPADRPLIDAKGNIRVENIETVEDVRQVIRDISEENGGFLEARRNILSDPETIRLAEDAGVDPKLIDKWVVGQTWNSTEVLYARRLLRESATRVRDLALRVSTKTDQDTLLDYIDARQTHRMIQQAVAGATAEAGRSLRAFRFLRNEGTISEVDRVLKLQTGITVEGMRAEAHHLAQLGIPEAVNGFLAKLSDTRWGGKFTEAWINSLVSGPHTHIVNTATNAGVMAAAPIETGFAAGVGRVFRALGREQGVTFGEAIDRATGIAQARVDAARGAWAILKDESRIDIYNQMDYQGPAISGPLGKIVRVPGRLLAAEDKFFKSIAFQQELNVQARRIAREEGLTGDKMASRINELRAMPTVEMMAAAERYGRYQTFQSPLGSKTQWLLALADNVPLMRILLPFVRTPVNLLKYSIERGPLGFFSKEIWNNMLGNNGAAMRDTQIARMALGNMVGIAVGYLALNGFITGGGPQKDEEQMTLRMTGWQPYSFRGGDLAISFRRFDPFSNTIGIVADMANLAKYWVKEKDEFNRDFEANRFMHGAAATIYRNLFDKLSLRGITGLIEAVVDWEQNGDRFVNGLFGSVVPGLVSQISRSTDDFDRDARSPWESIQSRIPWVREDLMPKRDRWGEPFVAGAVGPLQMKWVEQDPVNQTLLKLGINVAPPQRQISGVDLTPQQYDDYSRISGRLAKTMLDGIVGPRFQSMLPGVQIKTIQSIVSQARAMARSQVQLSSRGSDNDLVQKGYDLRLQVLKGPAP